jgi:hypothetical protein
MAKNKLEKQVREHKFNSEPIDLTLDRKHMEEIGWKVSKFKKNKEGEIPELLLKISQHEKYGINIALFSIPWERIYHFATGSTVNEEEAVRLFNGYLSAIREGKKYNDE